jgi:DNA-binding NarL/FixJ family response regulator
MMGIRVVVADDHAAFRSAVRQWLESAADIEVVGEAENGQEALTLVEEVTPDVLLLDVEMPKMTGIEVARRLSAAASPVPILVLSTYADRHYIEQMLAIGVSGYLTKENAPKALLQAVRNVATGEKGLVVEVGQKGWARARTGSELL